MIKNTFNKDFFNQIKSERRRHICFLIFLVIATFVNVTQPVFAAVAPDADRIFLHPAEDNQRKYLTLSIGTYTFQVNAEPDGHHFVDWYITENGCCDYEKEQYFFWYQNNDFTFSASGNYWVRAEIYRASSVMHNKLEWQASYRWNVTIVPPASLYRTPSSLNFGSSTSSKSFTVRNSGGGTLSYSISDNKNWISVSPTSGSSSGENDSITVTVNRSGLTPGSKTGTVTINPSTGSDQTVSISMSVPDGEPTASRNSPSSSSITLNYNASQTFKADGYDPGGDLAYADWTLSGPENDTDHDYFIDTDSKQSSYSHTFDVAGDYTLTCRFSDDDGDYDDATWSIHVNDPPKPDLRVKSLTVSKTMVRPGDDIEIDAIVRNYGLADAAKSKIRYYFSNTPYGRNTYIGEGDMPNFGVLSPNEEESDSPTALPQPNFEIPDVSPGTYYITAIADFFDVVDESDDENNEIITSITVQAPLKPDLRVKSLTVSKTTVRPGDDIEIDSIVRNYGHADAAKSKIHYYFSSTPNGRTTYIGDGDMPNFGVLSPDEEEGDSPTALPQPNFEIPDVSPGTYYITAIADFFDVVDESDDENNEIITSITVQAPLKPDLRVKSLTVSKTTVRPGDDIEIDSIVRNYGHADAAKSKIHYYFSSTPNGRTTYIGDGDMPNFGVLSPDEEEGDSPTALPQPNFEIPDVSPGTYYITAIADYFNVIDESDDENNERYVALTVEILLKPDLAVISMTRDKSSYNIGDYINGTVTIKNIGDALAGGSDVKYYLGKGTNKIYRPMTDGSIGSLSVNEPATDEIKSPTHPFGWKIPSDVPADTYYVSVQADSSDQIDEKDNTNNNWGQSPSFTIKIPKKDTTLNLSHSQSQPVIGQDSTIKFTPDLSTGDTTSLSGLTLSVTFNGSTESCTADYWGECNVTFNTPVTASIYTASASFAGTSSFNPSSATDSVTVVNPHDADPRKEINYPGDPNDIFWFVHISDSHIGKNPTARINFEWVRDNIPEKIKPKFIVNTGDLTDGSNCERDMEDPLDLKICIKAIEELPWVDDDMPLPDGPHALEWNDYFAIAVDIPNYYDIPGNHDRYNDPFWDGETGSDGYKNFSVRGSGSELELDVKSGENEGHFSWIEHSPISKKNNLFFAINTNDETGRSFRDYQIIYRETAALDFKELRLGIADMPILSPLEFEDIHDTLSDFRKPSNSDSGLAFIFGHASIETKPDHNGNPGLKDEEGFVINYSSSDTKFGASEIELVNASYFPEQGTGWIQIGVVDLWDKFTWQGKNGNKLTGCTNIQKHSADKIVIGSRPDRGASSLIEYMDIHRVSAYLYGHIDMNSVYLVQHPDNADKKVVAMNTAALVNDFYRVVAVDNGGVSTTTAEIKKWPVVLVTSPVNAFISGKENPYSFPVPRGISKTIRALIFADTPISYGEVTYSVKEEDNPTALQTGTMVKHSSNDALWYTNNWDTNELTPGKVYNLEVACRGISHTISIQLDSTDPSISTNTLSLSNSTDYGTAAESQTIEVWNGGSGKLYYNMSKDGPWIDSISPASGSSQDERDSITINYDTTNLSPGIYKGKVYINSSNALNSPQTVGVTLTINELPVDYYCDYDGDGYISSSISGECQGDNCVPQECQLTSDNDCNDNNVAINPGATEVCDGMDNDCDGSTDIGLTPPPNDNQKGVCTGSTKTCSGLGGWINSYSGISNYEQTETTCDGLDNDCDGATDIGLTPPPNNNQNGVCEGSTKTCSGQGSWVNDYSGVIGYENPEGTCVDSLDNDCDGYTDGVDADCSTNEYSLTCPDGGNIECLERTDGGDDGNNFNSSKPKVDIKYEFSVVVKDSTGGTPQYVRLYMTQRSNPSVSDFYSYDMLCTGDYSIGATCTYTTLLGPADIHKFYFEVQFDGAVKMRYPDISAEYIYITGPEVQMCTDFNLVGIPRDIAGVNLDGNMAFGTARAYRWDSDLGYYTEISSTESAKTGEGYFIFKEANTLPEHESYGDIDDADYTYKLKAEWNIISSPYSGNVKLSDIQVKIGSGTAVSWTEAVTNGWLVNAIYYYNSLDWGGTYSFQTEPDATLVPWMGYWINLNMTDDTYYLVIPKPGH